MFVLDGSPLALDAPFSHDGVNYPGNWLRLSTPEQRAAIGVQEVPDPPTWDPRFYWGIDQDGNLIPRDHTELVEEWSNQTRVTANNLLTPSDWMIVRQVDNGIQIDPAWSTWRETIRLTAGSKIQQIQETTTTAELASYVLSFAYIVWPPDPSQPPAPVADTPEAGV